MASSPVTVNHTIMTDLIEWHNGSKGNVFFTCKDGTHVPLLAILVNAQKKVDKFVFCPIEVENAILNATIGNPEEKRYATNLNVQLVQAFYCGKQVWGKYYRSHSILNKRNHSG